MLIFPAADSGRVGEGGGDGDGGVGDGGVGDDGGDDMHNESNQTILSRWRLTVEIWSPEFTI